MIQDINELENKHQIQCDICLVGAGAAGITLAMELEKSGQSIVLIEGGGLERPNPQELELYSGESIGRDYHVQSTRLRYFGGTTNHWGGWCRPLDDIDFEAKPYIDYSGWPVTRQDLSEYYVRAAKICEIENFDRFEDFDKSELNSVINTSESSILTNKYFVFSPPTRFGQKYLTNIESSTNIDCYLNANATELLLDNGRAKGVKVRTFNNKEFSIRADKVVLAMGGLENARFLLSNCAENKVSGIPNHNDLIGRFFMDHPGVWPGNFLLQNNLKYYRHQGQSGIVMPVLSLSNSAIRNYELNNIAIMLEPKKPDEIVGNDYFANSFMRIRQEGGLYQIRSLVEPTPYRNSRVTLSDSRDELGLRKLILDWQINPGDFKRVGKTYRLITRELGILGYGRVNLMDDYIERVKQKSGYGSHHMGTTRMGTDKQTSVVNSFGELHEVQNLYVAGSSTFPTVGFSNPTLTITALAVRLANHLQS